MSMPTICEGDEQYVENVIILPRYVGVVLLRFNKKIKIKQKITSATMIISSKKNGASSIS
jgi:hypothetical protein